MSSTYVYCVVASARRPRLTRVPRGLDGAGEVRLLDVDRGLFAVVADAPSKRFSEGAINRHLADLDWVSRAAVRHEAVVEHFIDAGAVLPMKLFTIFASDERAVRHLCAERSRLAAAARRVASHQEWGLRVLLDRAKAGAVIATDLAGGGRTDHGRVVARRTGGTLAVRPRGGSESATGLAYLSRKKAHRDASLALSTRARQTMSSLYDRLARHARLARRRTSMESIAHGGALLLDAAFLVRRSRTEVFRALAAKEARALAPHGYAVTLTGPWPPYTFVQD